MFYWVVPARFSIIIQGTTSSKSPSEVTWWYRFLNGHSQRFVMADTEFVHISSDLFSSVWGYTLITVNQWEYDPCENDHCWVVRIEISYFFWSASIALGNYPMYFTLPSKQWQWYSSSLNYTDMRFFCISHRAVNFTYLQIFLHINNFGLSILSAIYGFFTLYYFLLSSAFINQCIERPSRPAKI